MRADVVVFGASGDLAKRKLMPALGRVAAENKIRVIAYARSDLKQKYAQVLREFEDYDGDFPEQVEYVRGDYADLSGLRELTNGNTVFYFSVPPEVYGVLLSQLAQMDYKGIAIEKPFGTDRDSFRSLPDLGRGMYFVDHYLLKSLMVAVPTIRAGSTDILQLLTGKYVSRVDSVFFERLGAEGREYFDNTGCVKDVMQNHLATCLATLLSVCGPAVVSTDRTSIIRSMNFSIDGCVFGQYQGYTEEFGRASSTETFAMIPFAVNDPRWNGVRFTMACGKALSRKRTEVIFWIRNEAAEEFLGLLPEYCRCDDTADLRVVFNIAPDESVTLCSNSRKMTLYSKEFVEGAMQKAYGPLRGHEIVFSSLLSGAHFDSMQHDEIAALWDLFDPIFRAEKELQPYAQSSDEMEKTVDP